MRKHRLGEIVIHETLEVTFISSESETVKCVQHLPSLEKRVKVKLERMLLEFRLQLPKLRIGQVVNVINPHSYVDDCDFVILTEFSRTDAQNINMRVGVVIGDAYEMHRLITNIQHKAETIWYTEENRYDHPLKPLR